MKTNDTSLMTLIMILTFLIGGVLGILGLVVLDAVPVMKYIFSSENLLLEVINNRNATVYLDTCINKNESLAILLISPDSNAFYLESLYNLSLSLNQSKSLIQSNQNSIFISELNDKYNQSIYYYLYLNIVGDRGIFSLLNWSKKLYIYC